MDCSPPGSSLHGIWQARILEGLPFPPPRDLPDPEIKPESFLSPASVGRFLTTGATWEAKIPLDSSNFLPGTQQLSSVSSVQFSSAAQSCPTLCDPMNPSMPGLPVHHQLPEFTQTHAHRVGDAIEPSHPLSSPSPPAPNPSQHQGLF